MWQPNKRSASTKSPMGRSCMRGTPLSVKSPPITANAAVKGRMAVPALPMKNSMGAVGFFKAGVVPFEVRCPKPVMQTLFVPSLGSTPQPNWRSAVNMTRVSSESRRSCTHVLPSHNADNSRTRFEILLEPGRITVPPACCKEGMSRNAVANILEKIMPWASDWHRFAT